MEDGWLDDAPCTKNGNKGYKKTHVNHPCAKWVRESMENWKWLLKLGKYLCYEYLHRYGKIHACHAHIVWMATKNPPLPNTGLTPVFQAMPEDYKCDDPVVAYRTYYIVEKSRFCVWTKRKTPNWFVKI
jgi:hypothetical protein